MELSTMKGCILKQKKYLKAFFVLKTHKKRKIDLSIELINIEDIKKCN